MHAADFADITPSPDSPLNVVCFEAGRGDGAYPSYFGLDDAGNAVALVTDFLVLRE